MDILIIIGRSLKSVNEAFIRKVIAKDVELVINDETKITILMIWNI